MTWAQWGRIASSRYSLFIEIGTVVNQDWVSLGKTKKRIHDQRRDLNLLLPHRKPGMLSLVFLDKCKNHEIGLRKLEFLLIYYHSVYLEKIELGLIVSLKLCLGLDRSQSVALFGAFTETCLEYMK